MQMIMFEIVRHTKSKEPTRTCSGTGGDDMMIGADGEALKMLKRLGGRQGSLKGTG